jgi:AcrR family transcriptional regulator
MFPMPRPRTATDEAILEAAFRVISRVGPANLTLALVAAEVGLSPATLLQRFGTKRGLLLALAKSAADSVDDCFATLRQQHPSPVAALIAGATHMARMTTSPEELANGLAFMQMDLVDPEFHRLALGNSNSILKGYVALIEEAVAAKELIPCDAKRLARAVAAVSAGSLLAWAIHRQGKPVDWVTADLEALLEPYRRPKTAASKRRRRLYT